MRSIDRLRILCTTDTDDCVPWGGTLHKSGYPVVYEVKKFWYGNRLVCTWTHGEPDEGMEASHICGRRDCVNARHIVWHTSAENKAMKTVHGTQVNGEANYNAYPASMVAEVVGRYRAGGVTQDQLAAEYGIAQRTVSRWVAGDRADLVRLAVH